MYATVRSLPFVEQENIREWGAVWQDDQGAKEIRFACAAEPSCGGATVSGGRLRQLWLAAQYEISLAQAVDRLGEPAYLSVVPESGEGTGCYFSLYWPMDQVVVEAFSRSLCPPLDNILVDPRLDPTIRATTLIYGLQQTSWPEIADGGPYIRWAGFRGD